MPGAFLPPQIEEVEKEVQKRGLTVAQLRRLEPESTGEREVDSDYEDEDEDEGSEDASEGDEVFLGDYRKDPAGNYRQENYLNDNRDGDGEAENGDGDEPGDYRRGYD